ncbi:LAMP family protein lmp-1 [Trichostrongylus colubriformis]|uniref:LAMP family protein lmp-1 n=1 Tax=Trichostrongylus colubriformis TaxID=6319 RepID=A0AAN8G184_TRICO
MFYLLAFLGLVAISFADSQHWTVTNSASNKTCIVLDSDSVSVTVKFTENGTTYPYTVPVNSTFSVKGDCVDTYGNQTAQTLVVSFFPMGNNTPALSAQPWDLTLVFGHSNKTTFELLDYTLVTAPVAGMNGSSIYKFTKSASHIDLQGHEKNAFKCSTSDLSLSNDSMIEMKNVRVIAFALLDTPELPKEQAFEQCLLDSRTSDIVPIVVGACLAGLVVIVLVAYLIGRARAKRQGPFHVAFGIICCKVERTGKFRGFKEKLVVLLCARCSYLFDQ